MYEQPEGHRHTGFEQVPVPLRGTSCIAFLELIPFARGQAGLKYYVTEVSSSLGYFHTMKKLV